MREPFSHVHKHKVLCALIFYFKKKPEILPLWCVFFCMHGRFKNAIFLSQPLKKKKYLAFQQPNWLKSLSKQIG